MHQELNEMRDIILNEIPAIVNGIMSDFGIEGGLILITLAVTGMSYRSQKRGGIREAIEQLDPRVCSYREFYSNGHRARPVQVKAGLNSFSMLRSRAKIAFLANRVQDRGDRVVGHSVPPYYLTIPENQTSRYRSLGDRILAHDMIEAVEREETQLVITCSTSNPVQCRQVANFVLNEIDHSEDNQIHRTDFRPWPDP